VQETVKDWLTPQFASPSDGDAVIVTVPGAVHVKVGVDVVFPLSVPLLAIHW
jgi:hypothetical protein